ncbi:MAG: response regulator [Spongiibacteraceae bacterium]
MNVLIIDDSKAMQSIITKAMKSVGYQNGNYDYAADGEEGLGKIRSQSPDLVICDLHMPKMTGLELLKVLRNENNPTKVMIVSIDDDPNTVSSITAAGANAYLKKPFTAEKLFTVVSDLLEKSLEKKSKASTDAHQPLPNIPVLERILGSLAGSDVHLRAAHFQDVDFNRSPYYGGTFQDDKNHIVMAMFLDSMAANTIASIINRQPLQQALDAANGKRIDAEAKQALLAYLGIVGGLCKPSASGKLLEIHAEQFAENAHTHLSKHLQRFAETATVYSITCGPCRDGKIIFIAP